MSGRGAIRGVSRTKDSDGIREKVELTLIGSLSESGGTSATTREAGFNTTAGFTVVLRLDGFGSGDVFLFTNGFRAVVFFTGGAAGAPTAALDTARVVRAGAGSSMPAMTSREYATPAPPPILVGFAHLRE